MKILIIGGVATGAIALARLKRLLPNDEVILFEKDEHVSFANCGLPYYVGNIIKERDSLILQTKESLMNRTKGEVRINTEVIKIDPINKNIEVFDKITKLNYLENYDKLILAPGAIPFVPPFKNIEKATNLYYLRNIEDVDKIKKASLKAKEVLIVGSGFIGIEMAENLVELGIKVNVLDLSNQVLGFLDYEMSAIIENELVKNNINLILNTSIEEINNNGKEVILTNKQVLYPDMIISAIGVVPNIKLALEAGLNIGKLGGIEVNENMVTSDPNIYAGGDAVEVNHFITNTKTKIPLAWPANRHGRIIADHIAGKINPYQGSLGTSIIKVFNLNAGATGLNEKSAQKNNIPYQTFHIQRPNHATYYPNATNITLKVLYNPNDLRILGAQAIGKSGIDKRIDSIATAIHFKATILDLQSLELSYAPPFSSAKDPVNILGYVADNIIDNIFIPFYVQDIKTLSNKQVIDVRTIDEYDNNHINNSINIPVDDLLANLNKINFNEDIYLICHVGQRGYIAATMLKANGFTNNIYNLSGGMLLYQEYQKKEQNNV